MARAPRGRFLAATVNEAVDVFARRAIRSLRTAADALAARVTTAEGDITTLQNDLDTAEGEIDTLQADAATHESEIATLQLLHAGNLSLADDAAAYMEFSAASSRGVLVFGANVGAGGNGIAAFRVGAGAFMTEIATAGATFLATTTASGLTGTTGTDGRLTLAAHTTLNRLYVENRTGNARDYGFSFLGMRIGAPTSVTWTAV